MTEANYNPINENYLSLRSASEMALAENREKWGADLWDSELSESSQLRDRVELGTSKFSTAEDMPSISENDLTWSKEVGQSKSNNLSADINEVSAVNPEIVKTTPDELGNQSSQAKLAVDGQDIELAQEPGINQAFDQIGLTQLRNDQQFQGIDGSGMTVVVVDSGVDGSHPLIGGNLTGFADVSGGGAFTTDPAGAFDDGSHGTHVTGTVGALDPNIGVAPDVNIINLKIFGGDAPNPGEAALQWVEANREQFNIVAVNMSLGASSFTSRDQATGDIVFDEVGRLEQAGVTVVSAAGNSYETNPQPGVSTPGIFSSLVVGSVSKEDDTISDFSQRLDAPNMIFAPGENITSTLSGGGLGDLNGTSMATPHVAGSVALMQEAAQQFGGRLLSTPEVVDIMRSTANTINDGDDEGGVVPSTGLNFPRLNVYNAVSEVQRRFSQDLNGTIAGSLPGSSLDSSPVEALNGSIGIDGQATQIGDKDVDMYKFTVTTSGNVSIDVGSDAVNPSNFDSMLRLFDINGTEIGVNDDIDKDNLFSRLSLDLEPGTYYAGISGYLNDSYDANVAASGTTGAMGNYSLQFGFSSVDANEMSLETASTEQLDREADIDPITGLASNDSLIEDEDLDLLINDAGGDRYSIQSQNKEVNYLSDFSPTTDTISISSAGFDGELSEGLLDDSQFRLGTMALDESDRFIFNRANGILSYDSDGTGAIAPSAIASLDPGLSLSNANIFITA
jgi:hypothetical protein